MQYRNMKLPTSNSNTRSNSGHITVNGASSIQVEADLAILNLNVTSENKSLEIAERENIEIANKVLESLKSYGIADENIFDKDISISEENNSENPESKFFKVNRIITVIVKDFSKVKDIYDLLTENGANSNLDLNFMLSNPTYYYSKALKKASQDAVNKAALIAKNFNVNYNPAPVRVIENSSQLYALTYYTPQTCGYSSDVIPGYVKVTAEIEATFKTSQL